MPRFNCNPQFMADCRTHLAHLRYCLKLSQADLARSSAISLYKIRRHERGRLALSADDTERIAFALCHTALSLQTMGAEFLLAATNGPDK